MGAAPAVHDLVVTATGYDRLSSELEAPRTDGRRVMSERLQEARADGHLEDNPALFEVLEEQAQLERRIATLEARLAAARIAKPNGDGRAGIGSFVRLRDLETGELSEYEVVGAIEGDPGRGRVSVEAPVGRALLGAAAGEIVAVACPRRELRYEVISVAGVGFRTREAASARWLHAPCYLRPVRRDVDFTPGKYFWVTLLDALYDDEKGRRRAGRSRSSRSQPKRTD